MKILIVEDDRKFRALLYDYLSMRDHEVMAVCDAIHAVALLTDQQHGIDLVLLDIKMPRLAGDVLMRSFANWSTCRARFLIMSGNLNNEDFSGHPKVAGTLCKPFTFEELEEVLRQEIDLKKLSHEIAIAS